MVTGYGVSTDLTGAFGMASYKYKPEVLEANDRAAFSDWLTQAEEKLKELNKRRPFKQVMSDVNLLEVVQFVSLLDSYFIVWFSTPNIYLMCKLGLPYSCKDG